VFSGVLPGRKTQPLNSFDVVAGDTLAAVIHESERGLSAGVALIGRPLKPAGGLRVVGRARGRSDNPYADLVLRRGVAVVGLVHRFFNRVVSGTVDAGAPVERSDQRDGARDQQGTVQGTSLYRRSAPWLVVAAVALLWPARAIGPLDGIPLDSRTEAVAIGLLLPVLSWFSPQFFLSWTARGLAIALLTVKLAGALALTQQGWCERLITPAPLNQDANQTQLGWDARADWRSGVPRCSAIFARPYADLVAFPVWFLNLAGPSARPPDAVVAVTAEGYLSTTAPGTLSIDVPENQQLHLTIDDVAIESRGNPIPVTSGDHHVRLWTVFSGERWRLIPLWNGANLFSSVLTTTTAPTRVDRFLWRPIRFADAALALMLLGAWVVSAAVAVSPGTLAAAWVFGASAVTFAAGIVGVHTAGRIAVLLLLAAVFVPLPARLRNVRGAVLLVGVPWLALFAGSSLANVGRITLFTPGDDFTHFQRFAYRIYMQGFWLEGGQWTFWYQPLYRWIIGLTHIVFGDSSVGEWFLDAGCLLVGAQFAFVVCNRVASFRWGTAASALLLATVAIGPSWWIVGRDLSEITAAGFAYTAALLLLSDRRDSVWRAAVAGLLAVLCLYTRLNHLPWLVSLVALLVPLDIAAGRLWSPRAWLARTPIASAAVILGSLAVGLTLFAWRTWYYTGVFSVFHGTQRQLVATIQPTDTVVQAIGHLIESVLVLITVQDPPRFDPRAILVIGGIAISVLALLRVPWFRDVPAGPALFCAAGLAGALVARGTAYVGRFSVHLMPVAVALSACFCARLVDRFMARNTMSQA
jgi:hypothetical protein